MHTVHELSPKQREIREREEHILEIARQMFFEEGYYNLTMGKIAKRIHCANGTVYLHFPCKEDIIVALAERAHERRYVMLRRSMAFRGSSRERLLAFSLAGEYYARLHPGDMLLMKTITRSFREKVSAERGKRFEELEQRIINYLMRMVHQAVTEGDLVLRPGSTVGRSRESTSSPSSTTRTWWCARQSTAACRPPAWAWHSAAGHCRPPPRKTTARCSASIR